MSRAASPPRKLDVGAVVRCMHHPPPQLVEVSVMDLQNVLVGAQDALTVRRVFGEAITMGETTVLPAAVIVGGGGGGGNGAEGGAGFGLRGRPSGVFVIRNGEVSWKPAVDVNRIVMGGQLVAVAALVFAASIVLRQLVRG